MRSEIRDVVLTPGLRSSSPYFALPLLIFGLAPWGYLAGLLVSMYPKPYSS